MNLEKENNILDNEVSFEDKIKSIEGKYLELVELRNSNLFYEYLTFTFKNIKEDGSSELIEVFSEYHKDIADFENRIGEKFQMSGLRMCGTLFKSKNVIMTEKEIFTNISIIFILGLIIISLILSPLIYSIFTFGFQAVFVSIGWFIILFGGFFVLPFLA